MDTNTANSGRAHDPAGRALRQAAHFYLHRGLLPVPAWAARPDGSCCCPRGPACPRAGKHPRSVHTGPGEHDYSWKPLACSTHEQVEQRFAAGGPYAGGNLMLAIPPRMLVVDQDDDDGGPQAIAALAARLGDLPATLAHRTPHGMHRIYATPPGWTGRAWVGKQARNPLPPGIDLRVPGQILMAPPSQVPAAGGLAGYGPATAAAVAELPAAYLAAWTPRPARAGRPALAVPVPAERSGAAARYVHARITGILAGLAGEDAARNTALYMAALKIGSTLGAARATPGAEHAAAGWTDQAAADALLDAAGANGYLAKDGPAAARTAIRSGLRNGLRNPRPLPDFTRQPAAQPASRRRQQAPGTGIPARAHGTPPAPAPARDARRPASPPAEPPPPGKIPSAAPRARTAAAGSQVTAGPAGASARPAADAATTRTAAARGNRERGAADTAAGPAASRTADPLPAAAAQRLHAGAGPATARLRPRPQAREGSRPARYGPMSLPVRDRAGRTGEGPAARPAPPALRAEAADAATVTAVLRAAGFVASSEARKAVHAAEGYRVQATPEGRIVIRHEAIGEPVSDLSPAARTEQMLAGYARALHAAGIAVTSPARDTLITQPDITRHPSPPGERAGPAALTQEPDRTAAPPGCAGRAPQPSAAGTAWPLPSGWQPAREPGTALTDTVHAVAGSTGREREDPQPAREPRAEAAPAADPRAELSPAQNPDTGRAADREPEAAG